MLLPIAALLVGCSQIEDTAGQVVEDTVSEVTSAAASEVRTQICTLVEDGLAGLEDKELLGSLVSAAETAGVTTEITEPLARIAEAGDEVPSESVNDLQEACEAPSS